MRKSLRWILLGILVLVTGSAVGAYFFLKVYVQTPGFKSLAEQRVGEFFRAKVQIGHIRVGFFNRVFLSGIDVEPLPGSENPYQVQIEELVFRYDLFQAWSRNFKIPASVEIRSPRFSFDEAGIPYRFFSGVDEGFGKAGGLKIQFGGGEIRFLVPGLDAELQLKEIRGWMRSTGRGWILVDFNAVAAGFFEGDLRVQGEIQPASRSHRLKLALDSLSLEGPEAMPWENIRGEIRWEGENVYAERLSAVLHGYEVRLEGKLLNINKQPVISLHGRMGSKKSESAFSLKANFATQQLTGSVRLLNQEDHIFRGRIVRQGASFRAGQLWIDERYQGHAELDLNSGDALLELFGGEQRILADANLRDLNFLLHLQFEHIPFFGLDLVTRATVRLTPLLFPKKGGRWKFKGEFETEYFILEYAPFDDLRGDFEIEPFGIKELKASWGRLFSLEGNVSFLRRPPPIELTVSVNGFDLENVDRFASRPLPKALAGLLEGKLKIQGPVNRPEIYGNFNVKNGKFGKLDYDRGIFRFEGFPPYLPLQESRVLKGRSTLYLKGAIDLSLENIFHGVQLETADRIAVWKGWELATSSSDGGFDVDQKMIKLPTLSVTTGMGSGNVSSAETDAPHEEPYVTVGPKIKF